MKRIVNDLRQVNTWMAIAILALIGWLFDSLLWYLETHPLTLAGFVTYLGPLLVRSAPPDSYLCHPAFAPPLETVVTDNLR